MDFRCKYIQSLVIDSRSPVPNVFGFWVLFFFFAYTLSRFSFNFSLLSNAMNGAVCMLSCYKFDIQIGICIYWVDRCYQMHLWFAKQLYWSRHFRNGVSSHWKYFNSFAKPENVVHTFGKSFFFQIPSSSPSLNPFAILCLSISPFYFQTEIQQKLS